MNPYRYGCQVLLIVFIISFAMINAYFYWGDGGRSKLEVIRTRSDVRGSISPTEPPKSSSSSNFSCPYEAWNQVHSASVPNEDLHLEWILLNASRRDNILESEIRLLTSFVYPDHISVTTTSQRSYGQKVWCRYFDCVRAEIQESKYESVFFPMNVIRCPRRAGAKYMSISFEDEEEYQDPIPLIYRIFETPRHFVSACLGPLYGTESRWLQVAEFIEHYKLLGVTHFYMTIFNIDEYGRKVLDEYLRTGEIELTVIQSEYKTVDWQFHLLQINECHQRAKHHSKWVINVDIDERLVILDKEIDSVYELISGYNDTVGEIGLAIRRIQKTGTLPDKYESDAQIVSEMEFVKYNISSPVTWGAYKTIYRPEKIAAMYYHWAYVRYPNSVAEYIRDDVALFRHYRTTESNILGSGWQSDPTYSNFSVVAPESEMRFSETLKENILRKVKHVYDQRVLHCDEVSAKHFKEYGKFGHDIFHCQWRNETNTATTGATITSSTVMGGESNKIVN